MKLTALGDLAYRHGVQTPPSFWTDLYIEISRIADEDGDWEQLIDERIAGLKEMRDCYYGIAMAMEGDRNVE
jgi:hypothetical protein